MTDNAIEPQQVIDLVECYVSRELDDAEKYENRSPFDASGVDELHRLARDIYAQGVADGILQQAWRNSYQRQRDREREREAKPDASSLPASPNQQNWRNPTHDREHQQP